MNYRGARFVQVTLFTVFSFYLIAQYYLYYDYTGIFVNFLGLIIWWLGIIDIGSSFTRLPAAKKLQTKGIYRYLRHPIYTGAVVTFLGYSILLKSSLILASTVILLIVEIIRARKEETVLEEKFGQKYKDYKKKTLF